MVQRAKQSELVTNGGTWNGFDFHLAIHLRSIHWYKGSSLRLEKSVVYMHHRHSSDFLGEFTFKIL